MRLIRMLSSFLFGISIHACGQSTLQYQWIELQQKDVDVVVIDQFKNLQLFLNNSQNQAYKDFKILNTALGACPHIQFAMNAGMYHADYSAVGLYIEQGKLYQPLNQDDGYGNFFMQPNGVLAWNEQQAIIQSTVEYPKTNFKANYATQSGPMLVINGQINPQFRVDSNSLKIRNGVGVKNNTLYFVISHKPLSFYDFAKIFKDDLAIEQALYLDGTVSSIYLPAQDLYRQRAKLGPIVALVSKDQCNN